MAEDNKSIFVLISIVGIVAIVGLVVLILGGGKAKYIPVAQQVPVSYETVAPEEVTEELVEEEVDLAGEAYTYKGKEIICKDSDGGKKYDEMGYTVIKPIRVIKPISEEYSPMPTPRLVTTAKDECLKRTGPNSYRGVSSCIGKYCFLEEYYCGTETIRGVIYPCPKGCLNGACKIK